MTLRAGIRAGLIGAAAAVVFILLGQIGIPFLGCLCCGATFLVYVGTGALAGRFLPAPRTAGSAAGAGAVAGLVAGVISGIAWAIIVAVQGTAGGAANALSMVDPEMLNQLRDMGIDPNSFTALAGTGGVVVASLGCCLTSLVGGAGLGALGGVLYSAIKKD